MALWWLWLASRQLLRPGQASPRLPDWPTAVLLGVRVDFGHQPDGFLERNDDLLVMLEVVVGQFAGLAVFQPLLADLVAADVEVPNLPWDATELSWVDCLDYRLSR